MAPQVTRHGGLAAPEVRGDILGWTLEHHIGPQIVRGGGCCLSDLIFSQARIDTDFRAIPPRSQTPCRVCGCTRLQLPRLERCLEECNAMTVLQFPFRS